MIFVLSSWRKTVKWNITPFLPMHLFLGWRSMEDRIGSLGYTIERVLWGDSRARHTFLIACTDKHPMLLIEIDVGDQSKGIKKSMKLNIVELSEPPPTMSQIELIGESSDPNSLDMLLKAAEKYVKENPNYHVLRNNCRTFVEHLIDEIPEFKDSIPRKNNSILEYYHERAKMEHPGALIRGKKLLREVRDIHRHNRRYKCTEKLVLQYEVPPTSPIAESTDTETIELRLWSWPRRETNWDLKSV